MLLRYDVREGGAQRRPVAELVWVEESKVLFQAEMIGSKTCLSGRRKGGKHGYSSTWGAASHRGHKQGES